MSFSGDLGGFLSMLYIFISFLSKPIITYLSELEAIEEMFKAKS